MSICPNCNTNLPDDSAFCTSCGTKLGAAAPQQAPSAPTNGSRLHCPNCKSHNISISTESSITAATTVGQGNFASTMVSNNHKNFWFCSDCGTKFRNIQNLEEEIAKETNGIKTLNIIAIIASVIFVMLFIINQTTFSEWGMFSPMTYPLILFGIFAAVAFILKHTTKKKIVRLTAELEYLKTNCFN